MPSLLVCKLTGVKIEESRKGKEVKTEIMALKLLFSGKKMPSQPSFFEEVLSVFNVVHLNA